MVMEISWGWLSLRPAPVILTNCAFAVAARYGVTVGQIRSWNSSAADTLSSGDRLVIYANTIR